MSALPHLLPYLLFVGLGAAGGLLSPDLAPWADPVRTVAAAAALLVLARRGAYPELRRGPPPVGGRARATLLAVGAGVAAGLLWVPLAELVPLLGERGGFDPDAPAYGARLALRLIGSVAVVPLAEELVVRSLVPRYVDASFGATLREWRDVPVGAFTPLSFAVSVAFFAATHPEWLAALFTGALWTLVLIRTGRLRDVVLAHAVANVILAAYVLTTGEWAWW